MQRIVFVSGRSIGCTVCNRRWSLTSGTVLASTKSLTTWFRAMHAMTSTKQSISAVELGRRLGLSYPTAWYLEKRLHHAMTQREARYVLGGPRGRRFWTRYETCLNFAKSSDG